ncbi:hypothetical protein KSP40_PGU002546 [Platanthera guangdongensis]|uniref:Uncharacterized protein n=1 Tax=Platanthera guangdongensis TaxID=2320717 RepID=A0ABR2MG74_9ASPA
MLGYVQEGPSKFRDSPKEKDNINSKFKKSNGLPPAKLSAFALSDARNHPVLIHCKQRQVFCLGIESASSSAASGSRRAGASPPCSRSTRGLPSTSVIAPVEDLPEKTYRGRTESIAGEKTYQRRRGRLPEPGRRSRTGRKMEGASRDFSSVPKMTKTDRVGLAQLQRLQKQ